MFWIHDVWPLRPPPTLQWIPRTRAGKRINAALNAPFPIYFVSHIRCYSFFFLKLFTHSSGLVIVKEHSWSWDSFLLLFSDSDRGSRWTGALSGENFDVNTLRACLLSVYHWAARLPAHVKKSCTWLEEWQGYVSRSSSCRGVSFAGPVVSSTPIVRGFSGFVSEDSSWYIFHILYGPHTSNRPKLISCMKVKHDFFPYFFSQS